MRTPVPDVIVIELNEGSAGLALRLLADLRARPDLMASIARASGGTAFSITTNPPANLGATLAHPPPTPLGRPGQGWGSGREYTPPHSAPHSSQQCSPHIPPHVPNQMPTAVFQDRKETWFVRFVICV